MSSPHAKPTAKIPSLRPVQPIPLRADDGRAGFFLQDSMQLSREPCVLTAPAMMIAQFFNGRRSALDVQAEIARLGGGIVPSAVIEQVARVLDQYRLLDNETARGAEREILEAFRAAPVRKPAHAGSAYPVDGRDARELLDGFYSGDGGPGPLPEPPTNGAGSSRLLGVIAPHIDLRCGGPTIAWAYRALAEAGPFDLAVILGVGHYARGWPAIATKKDFETPLGVSRTDTAFLDRLAGRLERDLFEDELAHVREHSVEFQVLFLQHLAPPGREFRIVPLLCSSFRRSVEKRTEPVEEEPIAEFVRALSETIREEAGKVVVVAGVDLAHVGPKFGHDRNADEEFVAEVERKDREMLARVEAGDAKGFHDYVAAEGDERNICGHAAIYTMLKVLEPDRPRAKLLRYDRMVEEPTASAVSFASLSVEAAEGREGGSG
ncbi:MAG: AmmeMemoRadiSam system protein B, partial [Planctomycetes bacterium]|nr:AmmeMemoRadiSam system protein B [Planctomycetota bacterium]